MRRVTVLGIGHQLECSSAETCTLLMLKPDVHGAVNCRSMPSARQESALTTRSSSIDRQVHERGLACFSYKHVKAIFLVYEIGRCLTAKSTPQQSRRATANPKDSGKGLREHRMPLRIL